MTDGAGTLVTVVDVLKTGGPYTITAIALYVARFLYLRNEVMRAEHDKRVQALNDRIIGMAEKQNAILERATNNQQVLLDALQTRRPPLLGQGAPEVSSGTDRR